MVIWSEDPKNGFVEPKTTDHFCKKSGQKVGKVVSKKSGNYNLVIFCFCFVIIAYLYSTGRCQGVFKINYK